MLVYTYLFNCIGSLSFILFAFISCSLNITVYLETLKNVLLCLVSNFLLIVRAQRLNEKGRVSDICLIFGVQNQQKDMISYYYPL